MKLYKVYKVFSYPFYPFVKKRIASDMRLEKALRYLEWPLTSSEVTFGSLSISLMIGACITILLLLITRSIFLSICIGSLSIQLLYKLLYEEPLRRAEALSLTRLKLLTPLLENLMTKGKVDAISMLSLLELSPNKLSQVLLGRPPEYILSSMAENEVNPIVARVEKTLARFISQYRSTLDEAKFLYEDALQAMTTALKSRIEQIDVLLTVMIFVSFFVPLITAILSIFLGMSDTLLALILLSYATFLNLLSISISKRSSL